MADVDEIAQISLVFHKTCKILLIDARTTDAELAVHCELSHTPTARVPVLLLPTLISSLNVPVSLDISDVFVLVSGYPDHPVDSWNLLTMPLSGMGPEGPWGPMGPTGPAGPAGLVPVGHALRRARHLRRQTPQLLWVALGSHDLPCELEVCCVLHRCTACFW